MSGRFATALSLGLIFLLALAGPAASQEDDGSTQYEGTHDAGGTIRFAVTPQGTRLRSLELDGIAGGGCSWDTIALSNWGGTIEVVENGFEATNADGDLIRGTFPAPFEAEGTVQVNDPTRGCSTPPLRWTARAPMPAQADAGPPAAGAPQATALPVRAAPPPTGAQAAPAASRPTGGGGDDSTPRGGTRGGPATAYCGPDEQPAFRQSLAALRNALGDVMGDPVECEHLNNANGDTLQQTTRGLAYYRWATGLATFTDGWRHWALSGGTLIEWEGESPDPPR